MPFTEAKAQAYEPFTTGTPWGPPWGTTWFKAHAEVPAEWAGKRVEAVFDLGFVGDWPGNQAEAARPHPRRQPRQGGQPAEPVRTDREPGRGGERIAFLIEAASNPDILADNFRAPTALGVKLTAATSSPTPPRARCASDPPPSGPGRHPGGAFRNSRRGAILDNTRREGPRL